MAVRLLKKLRAIRRRLQWIDFCRKFLTLLKWEGLLLLLFLVVSRLTPIGVGLEPVSRWTAAAGAAILLAWILLKPVRLFGAALRADERLGLKERLSSALAIGEPKTQPESAVVRDAAEHAEEIRPGTVFRLDAGKDLHWALGPLLALAMVWCLMPQFDILAREKKEEDNSLAKAVAVETKKETARRLQELAAKINEDSDLRKPVMAGRMQKELNALAKKINEYKISPERVMAKVSNMKDRLNARRAEIEKKLSMPNSLKNKAPAKHTKDIKKALEKGKFQQAAKLLQELKKKIQTDSLSSQEKQEVQQELKILSEQMGKDNPFAKALANAAMKMGEGQFNSALADMEFAASELLDLEAMLQELKILQALEDSLDERRLGLATIAELCDECKAGGT